MTDVTGVAMTEILYIPQADPLYNPSNLEVRKMKKYTVAVLGATGAVGQEMINLLEERKFPVGKLVPLASARSAGKTLKFNGEDVI